MGYVRAQDTFAADFEDGTSARVVKGDVLPDSHELVKRDLSAAAAAAKAGVERVALFAPLEGGDDDEADAADSKPAKAARAAKAQ